MLLDFKSSRRAPARVLGSGSRRKWAKRERRLDLAAVAARPTSPEIDRPAFKQRGKPARLSLIAFKAPIAREVSSVRQRWRRVVALGRAGRFPAPSLAPRVLAKTKKELNSGDVKKIKSVEGAKARTKPDKTKFPQHTGRRPESRPKTRHPACSARCRPRDHRSLGCGATCGLLARFESSACKHVRQT